MRVKRLGKKIWRIAVCALCMSIFLMGAFLLVYAESKAVILQSVLKEENVCLFLSGLEAYENVTGQVGRDAVEVVSVDTDIPRHTIILIDNSLSVTKENFAKCKEILQQFLKEKAENEKISLAVYGTDIQYLIEQETDAVKIIEALEGIISEDKDTYLTDVLYDELQKLGNKTEYTRFIVVTDGVDNKEIGYTKEELSAYLKENPYPIYSLGCKYKNNDEQLKNLFAISRTTNAGYYLLDDYEEYNEIVENLCGTVTCVEIEVPDELKDGSTQNILLTFECVDGTVEISEKIVMPFGLKQEEPEPEPVIEEDTLKEEAAEPEPELIIEPEPVSEPEPEKLQIDFVSVGAGVVIVVAFIALVIVNIKKKKGKTTSKQEEITESPMEVMNTTMIDSSAENDLVTVFLADRERAGYIVVLRDNNDFAKVFRYPLADKVVIGRKMSDGVNIVLNYEPTVSAKHCEISRRGERFYIKDLHSSNKTFLNGQQVGDYMEFTSGSIIQMGNLKMTIEIERVRQ